MTDSEMGAGVLGATQEVIRAGTKEMIRVVIKVGGCRSGAKKHSLSSASMPSNSRGNANNEATSPMTRVPNDPAPQTAFPPEAFLYCGRASTLETVFESFPVGDFSAAREHRDARVGERARATALRFAGRVEDDLHRCAWESLLGSVDVFFERRESASDDWHVVFEDTSGYAGVEIGE